MGVIVLRSAGFHLFLPPTEELRLVDDQISILGPFPQCFAAGAVHHREAAQLAELLRELRDFR